MARNKTRTSKKLDEKADEAHPSVELSIDDDGVVRIESAPATALLALDTLTGVEGVTIDENEIVIAASNLVAHYLDTGEKAEDGASICTLASVKAVEPADTPGPDDALAAVTSERDAALAEIESLKAQIEDASPSDIEGEQTEEMPHEPRPVEKLIPKVSDAIREADQAGRREEAAALSAIENALGELSRAARGAEGKVQGDMASLIGAIAASL